jgi:predicted ATPase/class 3 adenylate cyclase
VAEANTLPAGTVTLLFADMEGSTRALEQLGDRYTHLLDTYRRVLGGSFAAGGGREVDLQGDQIFVAFPRARDAVLAAVAAQLALASQEWPEGAVVRARIGLHTGEPLLTPAGYVGMDVHSAARICAVAWGGQILISQTTRDLVGDDLPEGIGLRDLGAHRLKDLTHPQRLYQVDASGLAGDFPPLRSLDVLRHNLPIQLTSFIGREGEKAEVMALLARTRVLTLTGAGGAGKTRLALQVAVDVIEEFADGVWLADFTPISDPALVPQTLALAVGLREYGGRPIVEVLGDHLRHRQALLILDNCEHLVESAAELVTALLRTCPRVRVLATSRERLGVPGEVGWPVPPLSLPDPRARPPIESLPAYEAVQLFLERAAAAAPSFALTPQNAEAVAAICHRLDGIPLAVELAAARVAALSPQQIAARLDDRFRLLRGSSRKEDRHQTLWATLDWSYDLLTNEERACFRRVAVFGGSFSLEAAEAVGPDGVIDRSDVLDLITRLVDKSLITVERDAKGEVRYRILETIREYGRARLRQEDDEDAALARHLTFFQELVDQTETAFQGPEEAAALDRIEREHDNIRGALEFGIASDSGPALALAASLSRFWHVRGHISEGVRWLDQTLARSGDAAPADRAKALALRGYLAALQGEYGKAQGFLDQSLALSRAAGDRRGVATALEALGNVAAMAGDFAAARSHTEESLEIFRDLEDVQHVHFILADLGHTIWHGGDLEDAQGVLEDLLRTATLGAQSRLMALWTLGLIARDRRDHVGARRFFGEAMAVGRATGEIRYTAHLLEAFAWLDAEEDPRRAALLLGAAEALRERINYPLPRSHREDYDRPAAIVIRAIGEAGFRAAKTDGRALTLEEAAKAALSERQPDHG